mmetsp:Transcript_16332/g.55114  ORF Transcript_16332/g.55114 Transcript_16332/m.55114 type:complete len:231 (-) Transcript_16332:183-875(-)
MPRPPSSIKCVFKGAFATAAGASPPFHSSSSSSSGGASPQGASRSTPRAGRGVAADSVCMAFAGAASAPRIAAASLACVAPPAISCCRLSGSTVAFSSSAAAPKTVASAALGQTTFAETTPQGLNASVATTSTARRHSGASTASTIENEHSFVLVEASPATASATATHGANAQSSANFLTTTASAGLDFKGSADFAKPEMPEARANRWSSLDRSESSSKSLLYDACCDLA